MRRGAGAVPAQPHVTQLQEPIPRPQNVGTLAAPAADPRGHTGGPGRHLILAASPTSRVPVEVSHRGERSEERGGGLACGGASAQGPQARPRASQASRGLGTNLALATATLTPRQARRPGPRREGRAWEETPTPRVRTPRPVRLQAAAPRAWPQRPWPAWPAGDGSGGARRPPRNRALHVALTRPMSA